MLVHTYSKNDLPRIVAEDILRTVNSFGAKPVLLLFSGGSALEVVRALDTTKLADDTTISTADDRYTREVNGNNFLSIERILSENGSASTKVIPTSPNDNESFGEYSQRVQENFAQWRVLYPEGKVVILLGVGADGHTAGIFPCNESEFARLYETGEYITSILIPKEMSSFQERITVSPMFLRKEVDVALVYMIGAEKLNAFKALMAETGLISSTPARIVREMRSVTIYTDKELNA